MTVELRIKSGKGKRRVKGWQLLAVVAVVAAAAVLIVALLVAPPEVVLAVLALLESLGRNVA